MGLTRKLRGGVSIVKPIKKNTKNTLIKSNNVKLPITINNKESSIQDKALIHANNLKKKAEETATKGKNILLGLYNKAKTATKKITNAIGGKYKKKSSRKMKKRKKSKKVKKSKK